MTVDEILVIDDDPSVVGLLEEALPWYTTGQVTTQRDTGVAAQDILSGMRNPRIIVSDYDNCNASGDKQGGLTLYGLLQKAGKLPAHYIMISGSPRAELPPLPEGVEFFSKPLQLQELGKIIEKYD
jgi:CheY-like chemotaxis protein